MRKQSQDMWADKDLDISSLRQKHKTKTMLISAASVALLVNAGSMFKQIKQSLWETEKDKEDNNNGTSHRLTDLRDGLNWSSLGI